MVCFYSFHFLLLLLCTNTYTVTEKCGEQARESDDDRELEGFRGGAGRQGEYREGETQDAQEGHSSPSHQGSRRGMSLLQIIINYYNINIFKKICLLMKCIVRCRNGRILRLHLPRRADSCS